MYPEQKQTACSVGLDPEPYVKSLSHILPTQNRSENNSGYQKKSKFFSQKLYNVRLYTVFPLYTVVKFTSQVNGILFYPVVRTVWVRRIKGPSRSSGLSDQCAPKRAYKPCRLALPLTYCGYISLLPLPCEL